jgi:hypothetical protein
MWSCSVSLVSCSVSLVSNNLRHWTRRNVVLNPLEWEGCGIKSTWIESHIHRSVCDHVVCP